MIIIFDYNGYWSDMVYVLEKIGLKIIVLQKITNSIKKYINDANIIIPLGIKSQIELNKYQEYNKKFLSNNENIYELLDDKILFYNFISKENILNNSPIKLIKSYNNYKGPNIKKTFILKHRHECAAKGNMIKNDYIKNLIQEYGTIYQIQDYLNIKKVYSISFLCYNGSLIKALNFIKKGSIEKSHINSNIPLIIKDTKKIFTNIIKKIIKKLNLNGIHEIEFIKDTDNNIYLMEFNPRIAGTIKCFYNDESPFVNELIIGYCNIIANEKIHPININKLEVTYCGTLYKKYDPCSCGIVDL